MDSVSFRQCPLCGAYGNIDLFETQTAPDGTMVMAAIECTDCMVQVCSATLKEAIEKWDKLTDLHPCYKCERW